MGESVEALKAELGGIEHCGVQTDRRVGRGGAIVRTEAGEIDATIEAQLRSVPRSSPPALERRAPV